MDLRVQHREYPTDLAPAFIAAKALMDRHAPSVEQAVLASFITEGHFARHIRRTRMLYAQRQEALVNAAAQHLKGLLEVLPAEAGMHLVGYLPADIDDQAVSLNAAEFGVEAPALSLYQQSSQRRSGLLLGYAAFSQVEINEGVRQLAKALRSSSRIRE